MLTEVKAYSSWQSAPLLPLSNNGRAETDLIQVRNIDGLEPVKAAINTSPFGSVDGTAYVGGSVESRNIVLTLHPNPDWNTWTYESLRKYIYMYFMPKQPTRLVFYSDDMDPVEIFGIVEGVSVNMFSKDPELLVSIICPKPYFSTVDPVVITGQAVRPDPDGVTVIDVAYDGTVEAGINVKVSYTSGAGPTFIAVQVGDPAISYFVVDTIIDPSNYFEMSSVPMRKFAQKINISDGVITNLLSKVTIEEGSEWPVLQPQTNEFAIVTDAGVQDWELKFYPLFGGL